MVTTIFTSISLNFLCSTSASLEEFAARSSFNLFSILSLTLFILGLIVVNLNHKTLIVSLVGIELLLLSANINFIINFLVFQNTVGLVYMLSTLTISAVETAIGVGILVLCYGVRQTVYFNDLNTLND